ncbi:MAG: hypothetical protein GX847_08825 [Clostridiales bacterium]|nr:hypothetical protein [Clostridiales bacterium]
MLRIKSVWTKKFIIYLLGMFILALGIAFSVKSNLGVSPVTSVPLVLAEISGLTLGTMTAFVYILNMALQAVILRREYKPINLLQIAVSFLFGFFTDAALWLTAFLPVTGNYVVRVIYLALGIAFVALGIFFYLTTSLMALPTDGTVQTITHKGGFKLHKVKIVYDSVSTVLAIILSLIFLRGIEGIGIGTVAAALGVGRLLGAFSSLLKEKLLRFLNGTDDTDHNSASEEHCADKPAKKAG